MLDDAAGVLSRLARGTGRELRAFEQKDLEPVSDGIIIGYSCVLHAPDGTDERATIYINTSPDAPADEHTARLVDHATGQRLTAWTYPQDPALPSLPAVSYPEAAGVVLAKFGIIASGAVLTMESYRPGKRAVLRVETDESQYFVKIVQPSLAASIHELHARLHGAGLPVPRSLGYSDAGLLVLERQGGVPASQRIHQISRDPRFLEQLDDIMARFAHVPVACAARESLARRAQWYADRMAETAPVLAVRTRSITERIRAQYEASDIPVPQTVHGDLHLGQVLVDEDEPWRITGIIDIDTAGKGDRADDTGALYGHVVVSAIERLNCEDAAGAASFQAFAEVLAATWMRGPRVAAIAAVHLTGHALAMAGRGDHAMSAASALLDAADAVLLR